MPKDAREDYTCIRCHRNTAVAKGLCLECSVDSDSTWGVNPKEKDNYDSSRTSNYSFVKFMNPPGRAVSDPMGSIYTSNLSQFQDRYSITDKSKSLYGLKPGYKMKSQYDNSTSVSSAYAGIKGTGYFGKRGPSYSGKSKSSYSGKASGSYASSNTGSGTSGK